MRAKYVDVATDDVRGWFEACETEVECAELARGMNDVIDSVAATKAEWLARLDDMGPEPTVSYCWTVDGEPERCRVEGRDYAGEECYHCCRPINGRGVRLIADDGDMYDLHAECACEGCAARDAATIDAVFELPCSNNDDAL